MYKKTKKSGEFPWAFMQGISTLVPHPPPRKRRVTSLHFKLYFSSSGTSHFSVIPGRSRGASGGREVPVFLFSLLSVREWKDNGG